MSGLTLILMIYPITLKHGKNILKISEKIIKGFNCHPHNIFQLFFKVTTKWIVFFLLLSLFKIGEQKEKAIVLAKESEVTKTSTRALRRRTITINGHQESGATIGFSKSYNHCKRKTALGKPLEIFRSIIGLVNDANNSWSLRMTDNHLHRIWRKQFNYANV